MTVPLHPEAVPDRPDQLRWRVPAGTLPFVGVPHAVPPVVQALIDEGTLTGVEVEPDALLLTAGSAHAWRTAGVRVRAALTDALGRLEEWEAPAGSTSDDVLRMAVEQVIAGDVGDYVRGHGGRISLLQVRDGRVEVSLGGACAHCPASDVTLTERFEQAVRTRCPDVRAVVAHPEPSSAGLAGHRTLLGLMTGSSPRRRR